VAAWKSLKFDHQKDSRFPLTGAHVKVACGSCHVAAEAKTELGERFEPAEGGRERLASVLPEGQRGRSVPIVPVRYRGLPRSCSGCHADVHAAQFAGNPATAGCDACHVTDAFKPAAKFVHSAP